ncbi:3-dehydroquinate synthase [Peptostreptococcaceae bacterium AGR-M142]
MKLSVNNLTAYDIFIKRGLKKQINEYIKEFIKGQNVLIITDSNVSKLYLQEIKKLFKSDEYYKDINILDYTINAGEESKNINNYNDILEFLAKNNFSRKDIIIALGGGVVGDLAGFVSASYVRGISYIQIPTTLLSQVDSSVGGKTAINLKAGKNLAGAFYNPTLVLIDPDFLDTLSDRVYLDGFCEVIKYAYIKDVKLYEKIKDLESKKDIDASIEEIIYRCCDIKREVVLEDHKEAGIRKILNFGHSFGHAIEKYYDYKRFSHGEAVGLGMLMAIDFNNYLNEFDKLKEIYDSLFNILDKLGCKTNLKELDYSELYEILLKDKKIKKNTIDFIFVDIIGKAYIKEIELKDINKYLKSKENKSK